MKGINQMNNKVVKVVHFEDMFSVIVQTVTLIAAITLFVLLAQCIHATSNAQKQKLEDAYEQGWSDCIEENNLYKRYGV